MEEELHGQSKRSHRKDRSLQFKLLVTGAKKKKVENGKGERQERENPEETLAQKPF